jgi:Nucleotide-diphospho-sugar transferase
MRNIRIAVSQLVVGKGPKSGGLGAILQHHARNGLLRSIYRYMGGVYKVGWWMFLLTAITRTALSSDTYDITNNAESISDVSAGGNASHAEYEGDAAWDPNLVMEHIIPNDLNSHVGYSGNQSIIEGDVLSLVQLEAIGDNGRYAYTLVPVRLGKLPSCGMSASSVSSAGDKQKPTTGCINSASLLQTTVILTNSDRNYAPFLRYWARRIESFGPYHYAIECSDRASWHVCNQDASTHCTNFTSSITVNNRLIESKAALILWALTRGYNVLYSEMDVVWKVDVLKRLWSIPQFDSLSLIASGHHYESSINIGLFYVKSSKATIKLFKTYQNAVVAIPDLSFASRNRTLQLTADSEPYRKIFFAPTFNRLALSDQSLLDSLIGGNYSSQQIPPICNNIVRQGSKYDDDGDILFECFPPNLQSHASSRSKETSNGLMMSHFRWLKLSNRYGCFYFRRSLPKSMYWGQGFNHTNLLTMHYTNMPLHAKINALEVIYNVETNRRIKNTASTSSVARSERARGSRAASVGDPQQAGFTHRQGMVINR